MGDNKGSEEDVAELTNTMDDIGKRFPSVPNFRPVLGTNLYRSWQADDITLPEINVLKQMPVYSLLDMRAAHKGKTKLVDNYFTPFVVRGSRKGVVDLNFLHPPNDVLLKKQDGESTEIGAHFYINLITSDFAKVVMRRASWYIQFYLLFLALVDLICKTSYFAKALMRHVTNKTGLLGLYKDTLICCGLGIRNALRLLTMPENVPSVIMCIYGKDRTGLLAALVQSACGLPEHLIIEDYAKSQEYLEPHREKIVCDLAGMELDSGFAESKAETMRELLQYMKQKYGSPAGYMASVGFHRDEQLKLKRNVGVVKELTSDSEELSD